MLQAVVEKERFKTHALLEEAKREAAKREKDMSSMRLQRLLSEEPVSLEESEPLQGHWSDRLLWD